MKITKRQLRRIIREEIRRIPLFEDSRDPGQKGRAGQLVQRHDAKHLRQILDANELWVETERAEGERADLSGMDLSRMQLRGVFLRGANMSGANLEKASLTGADMIGADLSGANLEDADLQRAELYRVNLSGANLRGADLRGAEMKSVNLEGADLTYAEMERAQMWDANLRDANLTGANLRQADMHNADLSGANLEDAVMGTNGDVANIDGAEGLESAQLPEDFEDLFGWEPGRKASSLADLLKASTPEEQADYAAGVEDGKACARRQHPWMNKSYSAGYDSTDPRSRCNKAKA